MSNYVKFNPVGYFCPECGYSLEVEAVTAIYHCPQCGKSYTGYYLEQLGKPIPIKVEFVFR